MSTEENRALIRRYQEAYNANNLDALDDILAPGFTPHSLMPGLAPTLDNIKQVHRGAIAAFPDLHTTIEDLIAEGDKVTMRFTFTGTHRGDFLGIPATGRQFHVTGISIFRIADGKIVEHWGEEDALGWLQQLGGIPATP